jgi:RHS repeat-associated protein
LRRVIGGLDYADQRYYASAYGRFNTPDPYIAAAKGANDPSTPGSWNRYAYVQGDPVNGYDPRAEEYNRIRVSESEARLELDIVQGQLNRHSWNHTKMN